MEGHIPNHEREQAIKDVKRILLNSWPLAATALTVFVLWWWISTNATITIMGESGTNYQGYQIICHFNGEASGRDQHDVIRGTVISREWYSPAHVGEYVVIDGYEVSSDPTAKVIHFRRCKLLSR